MWRLIKIGLTTVCIGTLAVIFSELLTLNVQNYAKDHGLDLLYKKGDMLMALFSGLTDQSWFWYTFFVLFGTTISAWLYELLKTKEKPEQKNFRIPFVKFLAEAEKAGWVFKSESHHILDINDGVRQAALDGEIQLWGRLAHPTDLLTKKEPLVKIPKSHWSTYNIDPCYCLNLDNRGMALSIKADNLSCYTEDCYHDKGYADLQIDNGAVVWLQNGAKNYMGKNLVFKPEEKSDEFTSLSDVAKRTYDKHKNPDNQYYLEFVAFLEADGGDIPSDIAEAIAIAHYVDIYGTNINGTAQLRIDKREIVFNGENRTHYFSDQGNCIYTKSSKPHTKLGDKVWENICIKKSDFQNAIDSIIEYTV